VELGKPELERFRQNVSTPTRSDGTRIPNLLIIGILLACSLPFLLTMLGLDFGTQGSKMDHAWALNAPIYEVVDAHFHTLSGAFVHTLLEWSAFCVAVFVVFLALSHYKITNDITTPIIGVAFFMAGCMDAFHTLAADRLIPAVADNRDLIPFTWAICRTFNAIIMIAGVSILLIRKKEAKSERGFGFIISVSLIFGVIAYVIIHIAATTAYLPKTTFPNSFITRPYDALPLVLFLFAGLFIYPRLYKRRPSLFAHALVISAIPEVVTQLHMTFGSTALFDNHFNIAHFMKIVAYGTPLIGLTLDYIRAHRTLKLEIDERKITEIALKESETYQRAVLDTVADSIITIDEKGIIQTFNSASVKIFGYQAEDIIGCNVSILLPDAEREVHEKLTTNPSLASTLVLGNDGHLKARRSDGSLFPISLNIAPMELSKRRQVVGVVRDISERIKSEQVLRQFKNTLDKTLDCVFMFHPKTLKYFYVNAGATIQIGYSYDELVNMTPVDILSEYDDIRFRKTLEPMILGEVPLLNLETTHQHKNGTLVPVEIFLQYISLAGEDPRFLVTTRDISERYRVNKLKNEFISTVSHELRTPLTSVRGSIGLLIGGAVGEFPDAAKEMLAIANSNIERLMLLINDILDTQKIESGEINFDFQDLELASYLKLAIKDNEAYAKQYDVQFAFSTELKNVWIYTDKDRLMQVVINLMSNAAKFSSKGSIVEISISNFNDYVRVSVTDSGVGIPKEFQPRLFDQFTQSDSTDTRTVGGTGLGLSISKAIVEKLGGKISFESEEGVGSKFHLDFNEVKVTVGDNNSKVATHLAINKDAPRILIIEDDTDIATIIRQILMVGGLNADIASDTAEAKNFLKNNPNVYQAITLDIMLPGQDGISFLKEIRRELVSCQLPVVIVSAKTNESKQGISSGSISVVDWLEKPIDQKRLLNAVQHAVCTSRPRILHVEDNAEVRRVVEVFLQGHAQIVGAETVAQAKQLLRNEIFSLVLLDLDLPDDHGLEVLTVIESAKSQPQVVIFSADTIGVDVAEKVSAALLKSSTSNQKLLQTITNLLDRDRDRDSELPLAKIV